MIPAPPPQALFSQSLGQFILSNCFTGRTCETVTVWEEAPLSHRASGPASCPVPPPKAALAELLSFSVLLAQSYPGQRLLPRAVLPPTSSLSAGLTAGQSSQESPRPSPAAFLPQPARARSLLSGAVPGRWMPPPLARPVPSPARLRAASCRRPAPLPADGGSPLFTGQGRHRQPGLRWKGPPEPGPTPRGREGPGAPLPGPAAGRYKGARGASPGLLPTMRSRARPPRPPRGL